MFVYYWLTILQLLGFLHKLLNCKHSFQIIQSNQYVWILIMNSHPMHLMTIALQMELILNILSHIFINKMVWHNHLSKRLQMIVRTFGCAVYVPIYTFKEVSKIGLQRRLGIYVSFNSPSMIWYIKPLTGDLFTACFADYHFNETMFPQLGVKETIFMGEVKFFGMWVHCRIWTLILINVRMKYEK